MTTPSTEATRRFLDQLDIWKTKLPVDRRDQLTVLMGAFIGKEMSGSRFKTQIRKFINDTKSDGPKNPSDRQIVETPKAPSPPPPPPSVRKKRPRPRVAPAPIESQTRRPAKKRATVQRPATGSRELDKTVLATVRLAFTGTLVDRIDVLERQVKFLLEQESTASKK